MLCDDPRFTSADKFCIMTILVFFLITAILDELDSIFINQ